MEGAFATLLVYAFALIIAIILLDGASRGALIASGVLFVTAVIVNQLPIIPHMPSDGNLDGYSSSLWDCFSVGYSCSSCWHSDTRYDASQTRT